MAIKLGGIHSEDTSSFFMESSSQQNPLSVHWHKHAAGKLGKGEGLTWHVANLPYLHTT